MAIRIFPKEYFLSAMRSTLNAMFTITREIQFSYGHRILGHKGKCAHLHGHNGKILIELSATKLDKLGMVEDFYVVKQKIGVWIDRELDHRMILSVKDPLVSVLRKHGEPVVATQENPTAEVIAKLIFQEAKRQKLPVSKVTLWESDHCAAEYSNKS